MQVREKICAMDVPMVGVRYVGVSVVFFLLNDDDNNY